MRPFLLWAVLFVACLPALAQQIEVNRQNYARFTVGPVFKWGQLQ